MPDPNPHADLGFRPDNPHGDLGFVPDSPAGIQPPGKHGTTDADIKRQYQMNMDGVGYRQGVGENFSHIGHVLYDNTIAPLKHVWDVGLPQTLSEMGDHAKENLDEYARTGKGALNAAPFIGPPLNDYYEKARTGDILGFGSALLGQGAMVEAPKVVSKFSFSEPMVKTVNNPVEQAALDYAKKKNIPMTVGQATGQKGLQRVEQGLENFPGSADRAQDFYRNQREAIANEGQDLANRSGPVNTNAYQTGAAAQTRLKQVINNLKATADAGYDEVRNDAAQNRQTKIVGAKPVITGYGTGKKVMFTAGGGPMSIPTEVTYNSPIDLIPIRQSLRPIYEDLKRSLPIARQQSSPAFAVLDDIMNRRMQPGEVSDEGAAGPPSQRYMDAMDFDKALGAIKSITRDGDSPNLSNQSQGLAKQMIKSGEQQVQSALPPGTYQKLQTARGYVRQYHDVDEVLQEMHHEPAHLYDDLVTGGDRTFDALQKLQKLAPQETQTVGRTFFQGLVDKATREGGFGRADGVSADWWRMGPETKKLLFGPQLTSDINNFVLAAKRLTNIKNPSGSATTVAALHAYGAVGEAILALGGGVMTGHPVAGMVAAGAGAGEAYVIPNLAARMLMTPSGARLMTTALSVPVNAPKFAAAMNGLSRMFAAAPVLPRPPLPPGLPAPPDRQ